MMGKERVFGGGTNRPAAGTTERQLPPSAAAVDFARVVSRERRRVVRLDVVRCESPAVGSGEHHREVDEHRISWSLHRPVERCRPLLELGASLGLRLVLDLERAELVVPSEDAVVLQERMQGAWSARSPRAVGRGCRGRAEKTGLHGFLTIKAPSAPRLTIRAPSPNHQGTLA